MFSGIIREIGQVRSLEQLGENIRLGVHASMFAEEQEDSFCQGDSVSVSGVCLTCVLCEAGVSYFDLATETRRVTTLGGLTPGRLVNLERSLRFGERLDGHLVQGHVDAVSEVTKVEEQENTFRFEFSLPKNIRCYVAPKGSIAVDGVSLTVGETTEQSFSVYIIPFTMQETTFSQYVAGTRVNIETDCIARYLQRLAEPYLPCR